MAEVFGNLGKMARQTAYQTGGRKKTNTGTEFLKTEKRACTESLSGFFGLVRWDPDEFPEKGTNEPKKFNYICTSWKVNKKQNAHSL